MDSKKMIECPIQDFECPYWNWKYQKCDMMAEENADPRLECDAFSGMDEEDDEF